LEKEREMSGYACLFKVTEDQNYAEAGEQAWLQTPVELGLIFTIFLLSSSPLFQSRHAQCKSLPYSFMRRKMQMIFRYAIKNWIICLVMKVKELQINLINVEDICIISALSK
jgi:hypothetical protein